MSPPGTAEQTARRAAIDERRKREAELYADGWTQREIAEDLGIDQSLVSCDLKRLGVETRRADAIAEGVSRYWRSEAGLAERRRRSASMRREPPVERVCEWCGAPFELAAKRARQEPGRYCSRECAREVRRQELRDEHALAALREGREAWRERAAEAIGDRLTLEEVRRRLPLELRRSRAAMVGHVTAGGLAAEWDAEFRRWLISSAAVGPYVGWLRTHPHGQLTRFERVETYLAWVKGRFGEKSVALQRANGRLANLVKRGGPKVKLAPEEIDEILRRREAGQSLRQIVIGESWTLKQVRGVIARGG